MKDTHSSRPRRRSRTTISAHAVRRDPIDIKKLAAALIALAVAQAETDAQADHTSRRTRRRHA
jgi:hypothetical protein